MTERACPFLGLLDDPDSVIAYPSAWNGCHRSRPPASVRLKHQEEFCLGGQYGQCPVFLSLEPMPLPDSLRAPRTRPIQGESRAGRRLALALVVLAALLTLGWGMTRRELWIPPTWGASPTPPAADAPAATASAVPTVTRAAASTLPAATATTTFPLTPTTALIRRRLDMPIGTDRKFVIHRVAEGEKLEGYALLYQTSVDAILFINSNLRNPAWTDALVVIPLGFTEVADLPIFVVYQVKEEERGISLEALAKKLRVSVEDLKYYNGMTEPWDRPLVGDLFLVPWPRPKP